MPTMSNVLSFPPPRATFTFTVTRDAEAGVWVAVCDDLCVATEAPTYEALLERVWLIASHALSSAAGCGTRPLRQVSMAQARISALP